MKSHQAQGLMRTVLEFFHLSSGSNKSPAKSRRKWVIIPKYYTRQGLTILRVKSKGVGNTLPPRYSATATPEDNHFEKGPHPDDPPRYSPRVNKFAKPTLSRSQIESRIVELWKKVWLGLYAIDEKEDLYHVERLEILSLGAGIKHYFQAGDLHILKRRFLWNDLTNGIASLKLFPNLALSTLLSVIEILEAYEGEIENMKSLYSLLRKGQLALHGRHDHSQVAVIRAEYMDIAKSTRKRIKHFDVRMNVLNLDIYDEAMEISDRTQGDYVYYKAFSDMW